MAPLLESLSGSIEFQNIPDKLSRYLTSIGLSTSSQDASPLSINKLNSRSMNLIQRDSTYNPGYGIHNPGPGANKIVFIVFGVILALFIILGIWFFFRAPNGGFQWKESDWSDYKSTVLRRKGPNGTTLSGATESTDLGGGSAYKDYDGNNDVESSLGSEMSYLKRKLKGKNREKFTGDKRSKDGKEKRHKLRGGDANHNIDLEANTAYEGYEPSNLGTTVDEAVRRYRHEKPARVGGLNKAPDSSQWDGSTPSGTEAHSDLLSNQAPTPTKEKEKAFKKKAKEQEKREYTGGIRKISASTTTSSFWGTKKKDKEKSRRESKRVPEMSEASEETNSTYLQDEARRLQELGRAAKQGRPVQRDFSFQYGDDFTTQASTVSSDADTRREARRRERRENGRSSRSPEKRKSHSPTKRMPGGYEYGSVMSDEDGDDGDLGTATRRLGDDELKGNKSYHHPIPGLSPLASEQSSEVSAAGDYAGERRKRRAEGRSGGGGGGGYRRG